MVELFLEKNLLLEMEVLLLANKLTGFGRPDWDSVMGRGSSFNTIWARYIVGKSAAGATTYGKGYQKS